MQLLMDIASIVLPLYVLIWPKGQLAKEVLSQGGKNQLSGFDYIMCYVPLYNSFLIRKFMNGAAPTLFYFFYGTVALFIANFVVRFVFFDNAWALLIATMLILLWALAYIIIEAWVVTETAVLFGANKFIPLTILVAPIGAWFVAPRVKLYFNSNQHKLEGTFDERA